MSRLAPPFAPLALLAALFALGCGAAPKRVAGGPRVAVPLVDGDGVYFLRYNPPPCLADRPELHAEVETPSGWERVVLESADPDPDLVIAALTRFGRAPRATLPVQADLTNATRTWAGGHVARVMRLQLIDPVLPPDEELPEPDEDPPAEDPPADDPPAESDDAEPAAQRPARAASRHRASCASAGGPNPHIPLTHPHTP